VIRLALRVRREDAEVALAELLELAPSGVEELEVGEDLIEFAVYGAPGELPELPDLRAAAGDALVEVSTTELADDWGERWKHFHRPIVVAAPAGVTSVRGVSNLRVRPPWEPAAHLPETKEIVIDPGQAFGTGAHHTTRMCLELLLELAAREPERGSVLDVGSGSGVLAIAAALLGFVPVLGLDHEPESVQATQDNARANGVDVQARRVDLRREPLPAIEGPPVSILLANLVRSLLLHLAASLERAPRHLIASGMLRGEADEVTGAFADRLGLRERARCESGEWTALWLSGDR
jgi:ribosomal protein L11 methyltransferase